MFCGLPFGLMSKPGVGTLADLKTGAALASALGFANPPTLMWNFDEASGATELITGTDDLVAAGTPNMQVADATLNATVATMDQNTTDALEAALNTVADIGTETITIVWVGRMLSSNAGNFALMGKRELGSGDHGWALISNGTNQIYWITDYASGNTARLVAADHGTGPQVIVATRSLANNIQGLWTSSGSSSGTRVSETLTSPQKFSVGKNRLNAFNCAHGLAAIWIGTDGDNMDDTHRTNLAEFLEYE